MRMAATPRWRNALPEALARSQNDFVLSRPVRDAKPKAHPPRWRRAVGLAAGLSKRVYAGAVLVALLGGIAFNALVLQRERHPAPSFVAPKIAAAPATAVQTVDNPPAEAQPALAVLPPVRPVNLGGPAAAPAAATDPIGDMLNGDGAKEAQRIIAAAQNDLIRLGYALKANGVAGASTIQALHEFEKAHGLAISSDLTPHVMKLLAAAAAAH